MLAKAGLRITDVDFLVANTPTAWYAEFAAQAMAVHGALLAELAAASGPAGPAERSVTPGMLAAVRSVQLQARWMPTGTDCLEIHARRFAGDSDQVLYDFDVTTQGSTGTRSIARGRAVVLLKAPASGPDPTAPAGPTAHTDPESPAL